MNIKILDSWLRDYVKTDATPKQIAEKLSLSSVSVERLEKYHDDYVYDIEVTTNRVDLMSVIGLARETAAVLSANGIRAEFTSHVISKPLERLRDPQKISHSVRNDKKLITIKNDPKLINRIMAVVMEVKIGQSPEEIKTRLETSDIRSLNNLIDITNYVMRVVGHPTHVFDFDRLNTKTLTVREAKTGEQIVTLDKKTHQLQLGDIVVVNDQNEIIDLPGIMGLENSVVTNDTKRILFFVNNDNPLNMRKTSMRLALRSEAVVLNEKGIDPELAKDAMDFGIHLFETLAEGKVISEIIDIYPNKPKEKTVSVSEKQIATVLGVSVSLETSAEILEKLGFVVKKENSSLSAKVPSFRVNDIAIPEDLVEEIARIYGYHNIPNLLPPLPARISHATDSIFFWENRVKEALKYWGFTECYTYPMVSKELFGGNISDAVTIQNPLSSDMVYMRKTITPSLLEVVQKNKNHETLALFEISNVYVKKESALPNEVVTLAGVVKKHDLSFFEIKGILQQLLVSLGIHAVSFKAEKGFVSVFISGKVVGTIALINQTTITFELNFQEIVAHATLHKSYKPLSKYPPIVEDLAIIASKTVTTGDLIEVIKKQSTLISSVTLFDRYEDTRTFHVVYQSYEKNLTDEEVGEIRKKILKVVREKYNARLK